MVCLFSVFLLFWLMDYCEHGLLIATLGVLLTCVACIFNMPFAVDLFGVLVILFLICYGLC